MDDDKTTPAQTVKRRDQRKGSVKSFEEQILAQLAVLTASVNANTEQLKQNSQEVRQNTQTLDRLGKEVGSMKTEIKQTKEQLTEVQVQVNTIKNVKLKAVDQQQEELQIRMAMLELKERQTNLRIRSLPELEKEDFKTF